MKFTVSQSALMQALSVVAKGMASNSTLPVLSGIYIKAEEGVLEFQTTNLDISIRHRIAADVEEPGATVASGKILTSIVKTLPDAAVMFEGGESPDDPVRQVVVPSEHPRPRRLPRVPGV